MGIGPYAPRGDEGRHAGSSCPTGGCGEPPRLPWVAAHSRASAPAVARKWAGNGAEITLKVSIYAGQSLSQPAADSSLCTREPLGRGCGLPRRFAPRNDSPKPLSFRGGPTGRRGNPSFLRWTGVRAAVPRAWPPPTKFRAEIWGVGQVVGPYGRSTGVPATGRCGHRLLRVVAESPINHPSQPACGGASAPTTARNDQKSTQRPSQKWDRPRNRRSSA